MEITGDVYLWSVHEWKIDHLFCVNVEFIVKVHVSYHQITYRGKQKHLYVNDL